MIVVALLLFVSAANALPTGAPTKVCQTMLPFHGGGIPRQLGPSPYGVTTTRSNGDVVVSVRSPIEEPFKGVMLQARLRNGDLGGVFEPITQNVHTIDCDNPGDAITHDGTNQKAAVEVRWKPPAGYVGPVIFNATIAQEYSTFWVGVESEPVSFPDDGKTPPSSTSAGFTSTTPHFLPESTTAAPIKSDSFYDGCETAKLCFGTPNGCVAQQNCKAVVAVTVSGERYEFEMKALENPVWVGVGLSSDNTMGDDSVLECVKEGNSVKPYLSWTSPRPTLGVARITNPQYGIQLLNSSIVDDTMYCKVLRNPTTVINGMEFDLVNTKYYLLIAAGDRFKANGDIDFHYIGYQASATERYLSDVSSVKGASKLLLRLHGAFMLAAWIGTASLGTFMARYYRKTWVGKTICGKDLWFAWHRFFMVLTWALTTVAFVLIFVELKAWSTETPHAVLGCIVTALCFMQPIGAFFRPHPGTSKRPIFNWIHWFGGNAAHIIAIVAIFFAAKLNKAELPEWFDKILAAYVAFHVLMHLVLSILGCVSDNSSNQRVTAFPMKDLTNSGKMSGQMVNVDAPLSGARKILLGLYILIVAALTAVLIVVIALAPIET